MTLLILDFAILYLYIEAKYVFYQKFDLFSKIKFTLIYFFIVENIYFYLSKIISNFLFSFYYR